MTLAILALSLAIVIGIPLGVLAATGRNTEFDAFASTTALVGISIPGFWTAIIPIMVFAVKLNVLPAGGFVYPWVDPIEGKTPDSACLCLELHYRLP